MKNLKGLGINYPIALGRQDTQTYYSLDNERVKLQSLMRTVEGERFMQPTIGLNLYPYLFEQITPVLSGQVEDEIRRKVDYWLPNVKILNLNVDIASGVDKNSIFVTIQYGLKSNPSNNDTMSFNF